MCKAIKKYLTEIVDFISKLSLPLAKRKLSNINKSHKSSNLS